MADIKAPDLAAGVKKKFMFVNRRAPYGTIYALESLEVVLITAAFDQDVSLAFLDDGVYQLLKEQSPSAIGMKNFSPTYRALGDYEVRKIYVEEDSLQERGIDPGRLMEISFEDEDDDYAEKPLIQLIGRADLTEIMSQQDVLLTF